MPVKQDLSSILQKLEKSARIAPLLSLDAETYVLAIESAFNMIIITDTNGIIQYANPAVERITGFTRKEALGHTPRLWGRQMQKEYYQTLWDTIKKGQPYNGEITNRRKNGDTYIARITISPVIQKGRIHGYIGTEEDITIERRLEKEKEEFISMASHQLRTPLGTMKWGIELLQEKYEKNVIDLAPLAKTNQYMIDLINNLLAVLRIGNQNFTTTQKCVNIANIVREVVSNNSDLQQEKQIHVSVSAPAKHVECITDPILMKEIMTNVLDNAIKYSYPKGKIKILLACHQKTWTYTVEDHGIGISKKDLLHVSEKFFRSQDVQSINGTGLGLYIVSYYVKKLDGSLSITSSKSAGTRVTCTFPRRTTL